MEYVDILKISLTETELLKAVDHAKEEHFLNNLRERNEFVAFDSKVRGYIGEIFLKNLLEKGGVKILGIDYTVDGGETDIDIQILRRYKKTTIECKTSLIPDVYGTLQTCIKKCDIKIIRREKHYSYIPIDIHVQIYFNELRKIRDNRISAINGSVNDYTSKELVNLLGLKELDGYFVAWMDKMSLSNYLDNLQMYERVWKFGYRQFWKCPLKISKKPSDLISYCIEE